MRERADCALRSLYWVECEYRVVLRILFLYNLKAYKEGARTMSRVAIEDNERMSLRIPADEKATLLRAAALQHTDLTAFVRQHSLDAARAIIREAEQVKLSARDSLRVLDLLDNPPPPNAKLRAAAKALRKRR
jgi:uncharacterized protein (DUF1778 family)